MTEDLNKIKKSSLFPLIAQSRVPSMERQGAEWVGTCPFHKEGKERTKSFTIRKAAGGVYLYKCFGCHANGNIVQFVQNFDKVDFATALNKVKKEMAWFEGKQTVESAFSNPLQTEKERCTFPLANMVPLTQAMRESTAAQKFLRDRGIDMETACALHWGFTQNVSAVSPQHPWVNDGWIVMPTVRGDTVVLAKYRSVMGKKTEDGKKSGILRMKNMETLLYNLDDLSSLDDAFLVEGEPDCAVLKQAGYCVASMPGADYNIPPEERDVLMQTNRLFLAGDMDEVGRAAMMKLWAELRDDVYLIEWPDGCKDANDVLKSCDYDKEKFKVLVEELKAKALERPIPDFYDVRQTLRNTTFSDPVDNPRRLHMRDPNVDRMAITLPGNVVSLFATYPGTGKTTWALDQFELPAVMKYNQIVLNYSAELSPEEFGRLVTANIMQKDRLKITKEDADQAAEKLDKSRAKFYVGYNPDITDPDGVLDVIEAAVRRLGAHIVVLDHLHFYTRGDRDIQQQARAMQRAKNLSRKYGLIFVMIGQSRKEQQGRKGKPSELSDAKGSETFISDATTTYHIHRPMRRDIDWERPESWPEDMMESLTEIRLPKCRTKGPGKAMARQIFFGSIGSFEPYTAQQENPS